MSAHAHALASLVPFALLAWMHVGCASAPAPAPAAPAAPPDAASPAEASSEPAPRAAACERGCAALAACPANVFVGDRSTCVKDCAREPAEWSEAWAHCVSEMDCPTVSQSLAMNLGPMGQCIQAKQRDVLRASPRLAP